jgi:DNA-binding MarR family transcriptional regulator
MLVATLIVRCRRLLWSATSRRLEQSGESMHFYRLLFELVRGGPAPQRDLAEATAQHPAAVSRLVDDLEKDGLIRRARGQRDRRQIIVAITARGRRRFELARPAVNAAVAEVLAPLPPRDQARLAELLSRVLVGETEAPARPRPAQPH